MRPSGRSSVDPAGVPAPSVRATRAFRSRAFRRRAPRLCRSASVKRPGRLAASPRSAMTAGPAFTERGRAEIELDVRAVLKGDGLVVPVVVEDVRRDVVGGAGANHRGDLGARSTLVIPPSRRAGTAWALARVPNRGRSGERSRIAGFRGVRDDASLRIAGCALTSHPPRQPLALHFPRRVRPRRPRCSPPHRGGARRHPLFRRIHVWLTGYDTSASASPVLARPEDGRSPPHALRRPQPGAAYLPIGTADLGDGADRAGAGLVRLAAISACEASASASIRELGLGAANGKKLDAPARARDLLDISHLVTRLRVRVEEEIAYLRRAGESPTPKCLPRSR